MAWGNDNQGPWGQKPQQPSGGNNRGQNNNNDDELEKLLKKGSDEFKKLFGGGNSGGSPSAGDGNPIRIAIISVVAVIAIWFATGFYTVDTKEQGIVLRFGAYDRIAAPGLNYHVPFPFEKVVKVNVTERYKEEIGYQTATSSRGASRDFSREIHMLTGDENIININFEVQWKVGDAKQFIFNIRNPRETIRLASESVMREVVGLTPVADLLSGGRQKVQMQAREHLQSIMDAYESGISIEVVNMKGIPPAQVDAAFKDVQAAKINLEEAINKAQAYRNDIIPRARGEVERILQSAQAYEQEVIARSEGEADRFIAVYNKYKNAKGITKKRLYIETMEQVLQGTNKIILDSNGSGTGIVPYLSLQELQKQVKNTNANTTQ